MTVDSGTTSASGIGEKRDDSSVELSSRRSSEIRRIQTVNSTAISLVEQSTSKRKQQGKVEVNEDEEMSLMN